MKPIVKVVWIDAVTQAGWTDEIHEPTVNTTVGFEIHHCDFFIEIAATYAEDTEMWNNTMSIPKDNVVYYEVLEDGNDEQEEFPQQLEIHFESE